MSDNAKHTALLITFYWPPSGGPGVHRWLRFSRYFKPNSWGLHVYVPQEASWPMRDEELLKEIPEEVIQFRAPIFEPHTFLGKKNNPNVGGGLTQQKKAGKLQKFIIWTRGNLFVPDARVFWIKPSVKRLKKYLKQHPEIDVIISTGPPHSCHLIALKLKKKFPKLKWVADFRDPWTEIDFYKELAIGKRADAKQKRLEKEVLQTADKVISIGNDCAAGLQRIGGRPVEVITNGFIFPELGARVLDEGFTIAHFGSMSFPRNPEVLWKALTELVMENKVFSRTLKIRLIGPVDAQVFERIRENELSDFVEHIPYINHAESIRQQQRTQLLLLVANKTPNVKGILTGKFFEYLGAERPILAIGEHDSDLEAIIQQTASGAFFDYEEVEKVKQFVMESFQAYSNDNLNVSIINKEKYSSGAIANQLIAELNDLLA